MNCGREGHFARDCYLPHHSATASSYAIDDLIRFEDAYLEAELTTAPIDQVAQIKAQLNAMTFKDKAKLAQELGTGNEEDFPLA